MKKVLLIGIGGISFILGSLGFLLPFLPTVPFYMLTSFCWMRSSDKLYQKFIGSEGYQKYIQKMLIEKKISNKSMIRMFVMIFLIFLIPALLVDNTIMRICLLVVYILHVILLTWYLKFKKTKNASVGEEKLYD